MKEILSHLLGDAEARSLVSDSFTKMHINDKINVSVKAMCKYALPIDIIIPMGDASQQRKCAHLVTSSSAQLTSASSLFCQFDISLSCGSFSNQWFQKFPCRYKCS